MNKGSIEAKIIRHVLVTIIQRRKLAVYFILNFNLVLFVGW